MHHHTTTNWRRSKNERRGGRGALFRQRSRANEARIRRSRAGKTSTNSTERERERDPKIFLFFYLFFLPSFKKLVGKSALLALLATSPLPKNHPHFLLAFLFYQLIRKNALCVQQKTSSELTTFPSPLSLSLFPSPFDRRRSKRDPGFSSFSFGSWRWIDRDDKDDENKDQKTVLLGLPGRPTTAVGEVRKKNRKKRASSTSLCLKDVLFLSLSLSLSRLSARIFSLFPNVRSRNLPSSLHHTNKR